ncbi:MerR family transcriptional regulator [Streptomyces sp. Tue 6430]|nr:MerR family transcriptional regulator [Streptomyces sp. Tue 6430]
MAEPADVTVRTLHHYDEIGLVRPSARTAAGYRVYSVGDVERLREVLAYRRLGFGPCEIADLVDDPATDAVACLRRLRGLLLEQRDRAAAMVTAIDKELEARAMGIRTTPEEQLRVFGAQLHDAIGSAHPATRRTEPRIAARVWEALGDARTVLNVGAGTGSYEPPDRDVTAVEPSAVMRAQRPAGAAPCVAAAAESRPFEDRSFDAATAFSTVHHWRDPIAGLREMRRVARRVVVFTHDAGDAGWRLRFWLTRDYLPEVAGLVADRPPVDRTARVIGSRMEPVLVPWDCADGFLEAYWRRPDAYLDERVRRAVSVWTRVGPEAERRAVNELRDDLSSGRWAERNPDLVALDAAELGLRLLVA